METYITAAEFARQQGYSRSHITRLRQAGRLVTQGEGRALRISAEASVERIECTRGVRDDVTARHAESRTAPRSHPEPQPATKTGAQPAQRQQKRPGQARLSATPAKPSQSPPGAPDGAETPPAKAHTPVEIARESKAIAESRRVTAQADKEEMERDRMAGDLVAREDVDAAFGFVGATVRAAWDVMPDQLAAILAPLGTVQEVHQELTAFKAEQQARLADALLQRAAALAGK